MKCYKLMLKHSYNLFYWWRNCRIMLAESPPRGKPKSSADNQQPSRVLLVCIYDTVALQVNNQLVYEKFSKFGPILKVLIFEKGQVTKLFVEFTEKQFAQQAKMALDGSRLLGAICKMNIYYSNFTNVDLKNETSQGQDFAMQQEMKNDYLRRFDTLSQSFSSEQNQLLNQDYLIGTAFNSFVPRSKTDNPKRLQNEFNKLKNSNNNGYIYSPQAMINQEQEIDHMIHYNINNLLQNQSSHSQRKINPQQSNSTQSSLERINPSLKIKETSQVKSSVLYFQFTKNISIKCTYNLFSNFGNISFICKKNNKALYIKFRTVQFAAIAFTYLNEYYFMGNLMSIKFPKVAEQAYPRQQQFCQCVYYDESYDRFTINRSLTVNSPSSTLHVSSLKKQVCKQNNLYKIFSQFGKVEAVKILCYSNEKNMALVKFHSIEDSFEAIANLHNEVFSGRKMQISFTKSKA